jgi:hypothetical protein
MPTDNLLIYIIYIIVGFPSSSIEKIIDNG